MAKIISMILLLVLISSIAIAEDTILDNIKLTRNQYCRMTEANKNIEGVKGFSYRPDLERVVVVSDRKLTDEEKTILTNQLKGLPDIELPKEKTKEELLDDRVKKLEQDISTLKNK